MSAPSVGQENTLSFSARSSSYAAARARSAGVATEDQARECLRLGAADFIEKPVPLERPGEVLEVLEPYALERRPGQPAERRERRDRRSAPRAVLATTVRMIEDDGS
jgi:DNA-binding NtrC family response regulator